MENCVVIGSGYVGTALAIHWFRQGHYVTATTRSPKKMKMLSSLIQKSVLFETPNPEEIFHLLENNDTLALTMSADNLLDYKQIFYRVAQSLHQWAKEMKTPKKVFFTSNTIVYGEQKGMWVDEKAPLNPITEEGKILIDTENLLLSLQEFGWKIFILRLGEIYGPGREISKMVKNLIGHVLPGEGHHYTNMVHQADVVNAIDFLDCHNHTGIYNLADDDHPTRHDLYEEVCKKFHYTPLVWAQKHPRIHNGNKRVSNHKIKASGYSFLFPKRILS